MQRQTIVRLSAMMDPLILRPIQLLAIDYKLIQAILILTNLYS